MDTLYTMINFKVHGDHRGSLVALEKGNGFLFDIKRVFYIFGTERYAIRGKHAHKKVEQLIVCISGSCEFIFDNGKKREKVYLNSPTVGFYIKNMVWNEFSNFSDDCIVLVFASHEYDESEYIKNYDEFIEATYDTRPF